MGRTRTLDRALSRSGAGSRTQACAWIEAGRVRVNGRVVKDPGKWIDPASDRVTLDGEEVRAIEHVYLALHKPKGYLTTRSDPAGRATVYDLFGELPAWVAPVGRLDRDTSGLLLFTNDSDLADRITDPEHHLPKTYVVTTRREVDDEALERLARGLELDDGPTRPAKVRRLAPDGKRARIEIVLREGRNRQVRRMLEAVGHKVMALERIAIGPVRLGDLAPGKSRPLTRAELAALRAGTSREPTRRRSNPSSTKRAR
jgi:23S rRNA pseudouridine2605 synthase